MDGGTGAGAVARQTRRSHCRELVLHNTCRTSRPRVDPLITPYWSFDVSMIEVKTSSQSKE